MLKALMYEIQYRDYKPDFQMYENLLDKNIPVVEFGSGTGRLSYHLLQRGYSVYGIEKDRSYRKHFAQKISKGPFAKRFRFLKNIQDIDFSCNVIYPFNVAFYLDHDDLRDELAKLIGSVFNSIIIETDNILDVSFRNLTIKQDTLEDLVFRELPVWEDPTITIRNEILCGSEYLAEFNYELYPHNSQKLLALYTRYFDHIDLYGNFDLASYNEFSTKLIAVMRNRDN